MNCSVECVGAAARCHFTAGEEVEVEEERLPRRLLTPSPAPTSPGMAVSFAGDPGPPCTRTVLCLAGRGGMSAGDTFAVFARGAGSVT